MKIAELYRQKSFVFSIEIYPPKTQKSLERLKKNFRNSGLIIRISSP